MNITQKTILLIGALFLPIFTTYAIQVQSRIQNSKDIYGQTQGVVIDFDSMNTPATSRSEPLIKGKTYSVDSLSLRVNPKHESFLSSEKVYIGVYKNLSEQTDTLSGFLGISDAPVHIRKNAGRSRLTWTFSGIAVTPEANPTEGNDCLYFIFQKEKTPLTQLEDFDIPVMRSEIPFQKSLATLIRVNFKQNIVRTRTPNYIVTLSHSSKKDSTLPLLTTIAHIKKPVSPTSPKPPPPPVLSGMISFMFILLFLFRRK